MSGAKLPARAHVDNACGKREVHTPSPGLRHLPQGKKMDLKTWRELAPEKKKFVIGMAIVVAIA